MLSIIVPTLNEEEYLPKLLQSIKQQDFAEEIEIIVADAGSIDKTKEIAKKFDCKLVKGGFQSRGRNEGAKVAKGDLLLFIDADIVLPKDFLAKALKEFRDRELEGASSLLCFLNQRPGQRLLSNLFYNYPIKIISKFWPHGAMVFLIKKNAHKAIQGFNEDIVFLEDLDYIQRLAKNHKYRLLRTTKFFTSARRFEKDGWAKAYLKCLGGDIYMLFFGPIKKDIFKYKFNHYKNLPR